MVEFTDPDPIEPDENGDYTCPVCGDYTGEMASVAAHISGKSDDQHKGHTGKDYQAPDQNGEVRLWPKPWVPDRKPDTESMQEPSEDPLEDTVTDESPEPETDEETGITGTVALFAGAVILYWLVRNAGNDTQMDTATWEDW